jgi:hypothetical protein
MVIVGITSKKDYVYRVFGLKSDGFLLLQRLDQFSVYVNFG